MRVTLILAKMEAPAQRTAVTGHTLHAIVLLDILVTIAVMNKVIHNVEKQLKYGISLLKYIISDH